jgi:fructokinase
MEFVSNSQKVLRFAAIEGGGTSWVAAIMEKEPHNIVERTRFTTRAPEITLGEIRQWLSERQFDAIGVASFGPVDANPSSVTYGYITSTPKPGWKDTNVLGILGVREFGVPFLFDTDVNAPALAEHIMCNGSKTSSCAYITVGTGIGVGLVVNDQTVRGLMHPEAGHLMVARQQGDTFAGTCPYHGACVEGMCASGALTARKQLSDAAELADLPDDDPVWDACAYQLAQLCANLIYIASPERIVFGGGVMNRQSLYPKIRVSSVYFS